MLSSNLAASLWNRIFLLRYDHYIGNDNQSGVQVPLFALAICTCQTEAIYAIRVLSSDLQILPQLFILTIAFIYASA